MLAPGNSPEIQIPAKAPVRWALPGTFQTKGQRCLPGARGLSNLRPSGVWGPSHQPALGDHRGLSSSRFNIQTCLLPFLSTMHYLRTTESWGWRVRISSNPFTPSSAYSDILWLNLTETSQSQEVQPARTASTDLSSSSALALTRCVILSHFISDPYFPHTITVSNNYAHIHWALTIY